MTYLQALMLKNSITEDGILAAGQVEIKQGSSVIKAASLEFNEHKQNKIIWYINLLTKKVR